MLVTYLIFVSSYTLHIIIHDFSQFTLIVKINRMAKMLRFLKLYVLFEIKIGFTN